jgi:hypothetical protein
LINVTSVTRRLPPMANQAKSSDVIRLKGNVMTRLVEALVGRAETRRKVLALRVVHNP